MTIQSFNKLGVVLAFKLNQDYIAAVLCINKAKPEMQCNGQCVLKKKLKQAEQNEEKQKTVNIEKANVLFFCKMNRMEVAESTVNIAAVKFNTFYLMFKPSFSPGDIFKPPQSGVTQNFNS